MSWADYISNSLLNKQDAAGHVYNNVLTQAAIYGFNGAKWAATDKFDVSADEVNKLNDFFKQSSNGTPSLMMGGKNIKLPTTNQVPLPILKSKKEEPLLPKQIKLILLVSIALLLLIYMMENQCHKVLVCAILSLKSSLKL